MKKIVIGIDVGISTTKIVGIDESGVVVSPIRIKATDPITSLYGAFGKYLHDNKIALSDVEQVMLTGVGSAYIDEPIYGLPTSKSEEFVADGLGARYESNTVGFEKTLQIFMRCCNMQTISCFQDIFSIRNPHIFSTLNCTDKQTDLKLFIHIR